MNILFPAGKPGGGDRAAHRRGKAVCMKLVTFAVPCRNAERELRALCESLLAAGDAAEIFLIDDGSADGTGRIADEYAGERPEIFRVIHQENGGIGDCIDRAVRFASGRYFKVLDPREEIDAESLVNVMKKIRRLEAAGGVDMIVTNYTIRGNDSIPDRTVRFRNVFRPGRIIGWDKARPFLAWQRMTLQSCMFRTKLIRKSGISLPKKLSCAEDLFVFAMLPQVQQICYLDRDLCSRRLGAGTPEPPEGSGERWEHRMTVCLEIFRMLCSGELRQEHAIPVKYLRQEAQYQFLLTVMTVRLTAGEGADEQLRGLWRKAGNIDPVRALQMRAAVLVKARLIK